MAAGELNTFQNMYDDARSRAWRAKLTRAGLPALLPEQRGQGLEHGHRRLGEALFGGRPLSSIRVSDQLWINHKIQQVTTRSSSRPTRWASEYVDIYDVPDGHELCGDSDDKFMNGIKPTNVVESFTRTRSARLIAARSRALPLEPPADRRFDIHPGETIESPGTSRRAVGWLFGTICPGPTSR